MIEMKKTESKEERNDFKKAVKGCHIIPIWLNLSLSPTLSCAVHTKSYFREAIGMSRAKVFSTNLK